MTRKRSNVMNVKIHGNEWFGVGQTVRLKEYPSLQGIISEITVPFKGVGSTLVKIDIDPETTERVKYNMPRCCGDSWPVAVKQGQDVSDAFFIECRDTGLPIWRWEAVPK